MRNLFRTITTIAIATVLMLVAPQPLPLTTPAAASGQLERCADLLTDVSSGIFVWSGSSHTCANSNQIISRATFVSWISNNGSCAGSGSFYQLRRDEMIACTPKSFTPSGTGFSVTTKLPPSVYPLTYSITFGGSCSVQLLWNGAAVVGYSGGTVNGTLGSAYTTTGTFSSTGCGGGTFSGTVTYH